MRESLQSQDLRRVGQKFSSVVRDFGSNDGCLVSAGRVAKLLDERGQAVLPALLLFGIARGTISHTHGGEELVACMLARQVSGRDAGKQERARSERCGGMGLEQLGRATMASRKRTRQHHGLEMLELTCVVVAFTTSGLVGT